MHVKCKVELKRNVYVGSLTLAWMAELKMALAIGELLARTLSMPFTVQILLSHWVSCCA